MWCYTVPLVLMAYRASQEASLRRYTNWGLIFFFGLLAIIAATSEQWIPEVQPTFVENAVVVDFDCPRFVDNDQCRNLRRLYETDPDLAEHLRDSLDPDNDLEVLNEPDFETIANQLNPNTSDDPLITQVKTGSFQSLDIIRQAEGIVNIYEVVSGNVVARYLRFEDPFRVNNGPDLQVFLSKDANPRNPEQLLAGEPYAVGFLKGNINGQNFEIDRTLDLTQYRSVVIYSEEYNVIMAVAPIVTN